MAFFSTHLPPPTYLSISTLRTHNRDYDTLALSQVTPSPNPTTQTPLSLMQNPPRHPTLTFAHEGNTQTARRTWSQNYVRHDLHDWAEPHRGTVAGMALRKEHWFSKTTVLIAALHFQIDAPSKACTGERSHFQVTMP